MQPFRNGRRNDGASHFDIDVFEENELDEHIDVAKLDWPCYVEFATDQTPVENRLRAGEADANEILQVDGQDTLPPPARPKLETDFRSQVVSDAATLLFGGRLSVDRVTRERARPTSMKWVIFSLRVIR